MPKGGFRFSLFCQGYLWDVGGPITVNGTNENVHSVTTE